MKNFCRLLVKGLKWILVSLVVVELLSFLIISVSNYLIFNHIWEGSRVVYDPYTLFLNQEGPRPTANNPATPTGPNHRLIWIFGGSTTRGSTDHDARTVPSYLAGLLNIPGSPQSFTIINYGVNSFNSLLEVKYLQKDLIENPRTPDLIIFLDGANDSTYFSQYRTPYGHLGFRRIRALIESYRQSFFGLLKPLNAALYSSFTKEIFEKLRQVTVPLDPESELVQDNVTKTVQRYNHVQKVASCYGSAFLLFWQPFLWVETGQVAPQVRRQEERYTIVGPRYRTLLHNLRVTNKALATRLEGEPYFVDLRNVLCPRTQLVYKSDGVHMKDAGRMMLAQAIRRVLQERGLLTSAPARRDS